ncbi:MAG: ribosome small subunit-dependent GTPase A, partial [Pseudomonadota bacterium]|nr:ribosome small subunit-dependent GTPase A [Pseudomonadota bacterium]
RFRCLSKPIQYPRLPRRSLLRRPNMFGELKPVAANIDTLVIVIAPLPEPHANLVDRYLVVAENHGFAPLIVLNKSDLPDDGTRAALHALLESYAALGYPTFIVSSRSHEGLPQLKERLATATSIFVGQSGVGKSALVNALLPGVNTLEGSLSDAVIKGRHTTTSARLFHFPGGGNLIDSPGIREFALTHLEPEQLLQGFIEFRAYLDGCRFRDCKHGREPGCRLQEAVAQGRIDPRRLASYQLIRSSLS